MNNITDFSIKTLLGGYDKNFGYIVTCNRTGAQVVIDAAIDFEQVSKFIFKEPIAILITHSHKDHIRFLDQYAENYKNSFIIGHSISSEKFLNTNYKIANHNEIIKIGELQFTSFHTPGHYIDSICYQLKPVLFTGDTLFVGRTGRVINSGSNLEDLFDSIYNKILKLPGNTRIYPGHDYGETKSITLSNNIKISELLKAKDFEDFSKKMEYYEKNRIPNF